LAQLEEPFILVLDDYHRIHEQAVHDLLKELLHHPPPALHLVVVTRHNQHWFRYHHLFQKLLQYRLHSQYSQDEILALHMRASQWFEVQGLIDEALQHALETEDMPEATRLVSQHRHTLMNHEQWPRLEFWLRVFPGHIIDHDPELLLLKAWVFQNRLRLFEIPAVLDQVKALLVTMPPESAATKCLHGELAVLRSYQYYTTAYGDRVVALAGAAAETVDEPASHNSVYRTASKRFQREGTPSDARRL
jgi:ATP/maltotriose-dependent transcriptional regulator MalT